MTHPATISATRVLINRKRIAFLGTTALCAMFLLAQTAPGTSQTVITSNVSLGPGPGDDETDGVIINDPGRLIIENGATVDQGASAHAMVVNSSAKATILSGGQVTGDSTLVNRGTLNIRAGGFLRTDLTTSGAGSTITNEGTIVGNVNLAGSNGSFLSTGVIDGDFELNEAHLNAVLSNEVTGDVTINTGRVTVGAGGLTVGGDMVNNHELLIGNADLTAGNLTNNYDMILRDGRSITAATFTNTQRLLLEGSSWTVNANLVTNGGRIDMNDGAAGDNLVINGNMSGDTSLHLDVDLSVPNAGFSDTITVNGEVDGRIRFKFSPILSAPGVFSLQDNPIVLVDADSLGGNLDLSMQGLPQGNALVVYNLDTIDATSDIVLRSGINPTLGGVAGSFSVVQGIIGAIVNRPSGTFATSIAFDAENNCSTGTWARANAGQVSTRASTTSANTNLTRNSSLNVDYRGIQGGVDFGCFNSFEGGWDISGGLLFGYNMGNIRASGGTTGTFSQGFLGAYINAATGDFLAEAQIRGERGRFDYVNSDLGLDDSVTTNAVTFSGSASYRFALDDGWAVIPTAGLSASRTTSGALSFVAPAGELQMQPHNNLLGFLGVTVGRTMLVDDTSAVNLFSTLTHYRDFSSDRISTFTTMGGIGSDTLSTQPIKQYNEVSVGLNYINVINNGTSGFRQLNANLRADYRFGPDLKSAGVTAQMRLQF